MKRFLAGLVAGIGLAFAMSAHAVFQDGNKLLANIQSNNGSARLMAEGYIVGVIDGIEAMDGSPASEGLRNCLREGVAASQVVDIVRRELEARPDLRDFPAVLIVGAAISDAFPCPGPSSN